MEESSRWTELGRKVRAPMFSLCETTANCRVSADDRTDRRGTAVAIFDERYDVSPDSRTLYVSVATLKLILQFTGSQCSFWRVADILVRPCWRVTTWPACSGCARVCVLPWLKRRGTHNLQNPDDNRSLSMQLFWRCGGEHGYDNNMIWKGRKRGCRRIVCCPRWRRGFWYCWKGKLECRQR